MGGTSLLGLLLRLLKGMLDVGRNRGETELVERACSETEPVPSLRLVIRSLLEFGLPVLSSKALGERPVLHPEFYKLGRGN